jgi:hypothetical protein
MWARVKGRTENDLAKMGFAKTYMFRPGYIHPKRGMKFTLPMYRYVDWAWPLFRILFPGFVSTQQQLGRAMIAAAYFRPDLKVVEVKDINNMAKRLDEDHSNNSGHDEIRRETKEGEQQSVGILPDRDLKKNLGCG